MSATDAMHLDLKRRRRPWLDAWRSWPVRIAAAILGGAALASVVGILLLHLDPNAQAGEPFVGPQAGHWFGTDIHGRDVLARVLAGSRLSLVVGLVGACVSLMIGVVWGMIAAYAGGSVDEFMMRVVDILYSLPNLVFVMLAIGFLEPWVNRWVEHAFPSAVPSTRLVLLIGCLGAISWLNMARIVRGQVLSLRSRPFVLASQALGSSHTRILWRHILPNIAGVIIVYTTLTAPTVMLYESFLSFLGLGVRPPSASLGTLIADGAAQLNSLRIRWWLLVCPATVLTAILLSLNAIGNALREAFDPRSDRR